jgi:hypothetical protein
LSLPVVFVFADLVADETTDRRAADRPDRAATREHGAANRADAGAYRGVFIARRHLSTTTQAEQYCCGNRTDRKPVHRFHGNIPFELQL